jgi:uncharacterized protein YegP (UPF0339 family)
MEIDGYLPCESYSGHTDSPAEGFITFIGEDAENYFAMVGKDGSVLLRSEGYPTVLARDNGLASVQKNRELKERYKIVEDGGQWYVTLKAGNHQEIARSCGFGSEAEALARFSFLKEGSTDDFTWNLAPAPVAAAAEAEAEVSRKSQNVEDDYLLCSEYKDRIADSKLADSPDFIAFQHSNGKYYFGVLNAYGDLRFRSEGYPTIAARDNGIASVKKNIDIKERFSVEEIRGHFFQVLKAGNHQEIARSCPYKSIADIDAKPVVAAAAPEAIAETARKSENVEDDYLVCGEYKDRIADSKLADSPDFIAFQHANGKYYFGVLDAAGELRLRSEGYPTVAARDNGIASVKKNIDIPERWSTEEVRGFHFKVLKAGNHQEIARSCPYKTAAEIDAKPIAAAVAAVAATTVAAAAPAPKREEYVAPVAESVVEETGGGIGKWLPWLIGALLLGGLLWWMMKGCDKPKEAAVTETVQTDTTTVAADTTVAAAPAVASSSCGCSGNAEAIFNIPTDKVAKKLPRLGTNPEFARYGNIHKMNAAQFLELLTGRAAKSSVDKEFLDRVTKAMGYANGIADVKEANISEHTFPIGTKGNLGWGAAHNTAYDELPDNERDRQAFKIVGNGGCSIYFMKTCGNHMVPSTNCD